MQDRAGPPGLWSRIGTGEPTYPAYPAQIFPPPPSPVDSKWTEISIVLFYSFLFTLNWTVCYVLMFLNPIVNCPKPFGGRQCINWTIIIIINGKYLKCLFQFTHWVMPQPQQVKALPTLLPWKLIPQCQCVCLTDCSHRSNKPLGGGKDGNPWVVHERYNHTDLAHGSQARLCSMTKFGPYPSLFDNSSNISTSGIQRYNCP